MYASNTQAILQWQQPASRVNHHDASEFLNDDLFYKYIDLQLHVVHRILTGWGYVFFPFWSPFYAYQHQLCFSSSTIWWQKMHRQLQQWYGPVAKPWQLYTKIINLPFSLIAADGSRRLIQIVVIYLLNLDEIWNLVWGFRRYPYLGEGVFFNCLLWFCEGCMLRDWDSWRGCKAWEMNYCLDMWSKFEEEFKKNMKKNCFCTWGGVRVGVCVWENVWRSVLKVCMFVGVFGEGVYMS